MACFASIPRQVRTVVMSGTVGSGPFGNDAVMGLAIQPGGTILLTVGPDPANNFNGLLAINPTTGDRTFLSDATHGSGPTFQELLTVAVVPLPGDANGDGIVNSQDLAAISSQWNQSGAFLVGDANNDGIVNTQDLALVSSNWLGTALERRDGSQQYCRRARAFDAVSRHRSLPCAGDACAVASRVHFAGHRHDGQCISFPRMLPDCPRVILSLRRTSPRATRA